MSRILAGLLLAVLFAMPAARLPVRAQGGTYYVATTGSDTTGNGIDWRETEPQMNIDSLGFCP